MNNGNFTREDINLIDKAYQELLVLARQRCRNNGELDVVKQAFEFANNAHKNVRRQSGEPYMIHPINVAKIVIEDIGLGYKSIVTALLHDVVEDTKYTSEDIKNIFGVKIASLVDGLTKIKIMLDNEERNGSSLETRNIQAENLKRILLTLNEDVRVVLIKLADRLHNCRTIESLPEKKRTKVLSETMFIFIPLAHRLGLYGIKTEMEDIWLKYSEPQAYKDIVSKINKSFKSNSNAIEEFIVPIKDALDQENFKYTIKQRVKSPYSIWFKMKNKNVTFEQVYDLYAIRIVFEPTVPTAEMEKKQTYMIYADLINLYKENPGRRRDWIETPKSNGYEALHSTFMSHSGIWIEVQIRSQRMDDIAEKGIAAHWSYKNNGYVSETDASIDKWLGKVQEILLSEDINALELLDIIHTDLLTNEIVVFTPKGEQKTIQNGATALDFAYAIHTKVGHGAIGAKINNRFSPLSQVLKAGDQVEIISEPGTFPKKEWLKIVKTRHARNCIIEYFRANDRKRIENKGESIYKERLKLMNLKSTQEILRMFKERYLLTDDAELFFRIGLGLINTEEFKALLSAGSTEQNRYTFANCCNPIPGDNIIGFVQDDGSVEIHQKTCEVAERLASFMPDKLVIPKLTIKDNEFPVKISLMGVDRKGMLSELTHFISLTMEVNIRKVKLSCEYGIMEGSIEMYVKDKKALERMIEGMKNIDGIKDVVRTDI